MAKDHDAQLAEQVAMFEQANALLDRILGANRPPDPSEEDDLAVLLAGPYGVAWRRGQDPVQAPPAAWEPIVLELGEAVATGFHLDPIWADDLATHA